MPFTPNEAFDLLQSAKAQNRLAHAFLLTGPTGSGKRALAKRVASLLVGRDVTDFQHPDIHVIEPESKSRRILIDQIRELERILHMRSLSGGMKVGVIIDADRLQPNAANAFLKTLEEPPGATSLLLLSSLPDQLLETILSRCLEISLRSVGPRELTALQARLVGLLQNQARHSSAGMVDAFWMVREFQNLLAEGRESIQADAEKAFKSEEHHYKQTSDAGRWLAEREDYYKALVESRYVGTRNQLLETLEQWWADALRQQVATNESHEAPALDLPGAAAETGAIANRYQPALLLRKAEALEKLREHLGSNGVQEQLALECAFLRCFGE